MSGVLVPLRAAVRPLKALPGFLWARWDRACGGAVARPVRAVRVLAAVVGGLALLAGLSWFGTYRYQRLEAARVEATATAEDSVVALMSYNFRSIDRQVERTRDLVTGKFAEEYAGFLTTSVMPAAKERQISVQTSVTDTSVVDSGSGEVVLLMLVEQQSESKLRPDQATGSGVTALRVTLQERDGTWRVSELSTV